MNGPAFPLVFQIAAGALDPDGAKAEHPQQHIFYGMSVRGYFAAHAPAEPQPWFLPLLPGRPAEPPDKPSLPEDFPDRAEDRNFIINLAWSWRKDPCWDLSTHLSDRPNETWRSHENALLAHAHPFLADYEKAWLAYWETKREYDLECQRQRCVQWPWAYADAVLAAGRSL